MNIKRNSLVSSFVGHPAVCLDFVIVLTLITSSTNGERTILRTADNALQFWDESDMLCSLLEQGNFSLVILGHLPFDINGHVTHRLIQTSHRVDIPVNWTLGSTQIRQAIQSFDAVLLLLRLLMLSHTEASAFCKLPTKASTLDATLTLAAYISEQTLLAITDGGLSEEETKVSELVLLRPVLPIVAFDSNLMDALVT